MLSIEALCVSKDYERYDAMYTDNTTNFRERMSEEQLCRMLDGRMASGAPSAGEISSTGHRGWGLEGYPLASVYAPLQAFHKLYDQEAALEKGTLFSELYLPFMGESIVGNGGGCRD